MSSRIAIKRGDTLYQVFTWKNADGEPINLTGCQARLQLRTRNDRLIFSATTENDCIEIEPTENEIDTTGQVHLKISAEDTAKFTPETYNSDLEITWSDGTVCSTDTFTIKILKDETQ